MAHLTNFSFEFFYKIFAEDASQLLLYHGAKKSKMTKNSNQGGPALNLFFLLSHRTCLARSRYRRRPAGYKNIFREFCYKKKSVGLPPQTMRNSSIGSASALPIIRHLSSIRLCFVNTEKIPHQVCLEPDLLVATRCHAI